MGNLDRVTCTVHSISEPRPARKDSNVTSDAMKIEPLVKDYCVWFDFYFTTNKEKLGGGCPNIIYCGHISINTFE